MSDTLKAHHTHRYAPAGACIYCGSTGSLSDEHIVPYGLGGTLILPQSSCKRCADVTSRVERKVLRGFMHDARTASDMPSRRKKARPDHLAMTFIGDHGATFSQDVPLEDATAILHLPVLDTPTFLGATPISDGVRVAGMETLHLGKPARRLAGKHDAHGLRFDARIDVPAFVRMLAKIAHAYLVGACGIFPADQSPLLPLIRSERKDFGNWIGSIDFPTPPGSRTALHLLATSEVASSSGELGTVVLIKLWSGSTEMAYVAAARIPDWRSMFG